MEEWIHPRDHAGYAASYVRFADSVVAEKERDAARVAENWTKLPSPDDLVHRTALIQKPFGVAEGKIIDEGGRHDLRHVVGRQSAGAVALVGRDNTILAVPRDGLGLRVGGGIFNGLRVGIRQEHIDAMVEAALHTPLERMVDRVANILVEPSQTAAILRVG